MITGNSETRVSGGSVSGSRRGLDELAVSAQYELRGLARMCLNRSHRTQILDPAELIDEMYVRLISQSAPLQWQNRSHFFAIAARLMRNILADWARAGCAVKRGGNALRISLDEAESLASPEHIFDILEIDGAMDRLSKAHAREARVIELRYFTGMSRREVAMSEGLTLATVKRDLRLGEAWLRRDLSGL